MSFPTLSAIAGTPGLRIDYSSEHYAAFPIDPDGNNVDTVFMK